MKTNLRFLIIILCFVVACSDTEKKNNNSQDSPLTAAQLKILDEAPDVDVPLESTILPNGKNVVEFLTEYDPSFLQSLDGGRVASTDLTPQNQKNLLIARMEARAHDLVNRSTYKKTTGQENGLSYVFGGKELKLMTPVGECTDKQLVGLDCSGLIYQLAQSAKLFTFPEGNAENQGQVETWNNAFKKSAEFTKLTAERIDNILASEMIAGDIIYWINDGDVTHTGVVLNTDGGGLKIYQSNGTSEASNDCAANYGPKRGPRSIYVSAANLGAFGDSYYAIRPSADISGSWTVRLRCQSQTNDAITADITFKTKSDDSFTATGSGTDYTGEPLTVKITGVYKKKENKLEGDLEFSFVTSPDDTRKDHFSVVLNEDETPYISTTKVIDNGGCYVEIKLINNETN
jgi:hypothetical protein